MGEREIHSALKLIPESSLFGSKGMNPQIRWITGLLKAHQIPYWLDSGTLLSLMRGGDLIQHDDIDIGTWSRYAHRIRKILPLVAETGHTIEVYSYGNLVHKYKFHPPTRSAREIDITLFRKHGAYAWCPQGFYNNPYRPGSISYYRYYLFRYHLLAVLLFIKRWFPVNDLIWPWRMFVDVGTWWIPRFYFDNLTHLKDLDISIPQDWESYLKFRYGNWKTPVREWYYARDDGGFQRKAPDKILKNSYLSSRSFVLRRC